MTNSITIIKGYKTELALNDKQRSLFNRYAGTARFVYNWALNDRKTRYEESGESIGKYTQCKNFNSLKYDEFPWITETPYAITESAIANCDIAFKHFFRRVKNGEKPGYPKFKNRFRHKSFQLRDTKVEVDRVRLTRVGWVRLKERSYIPYGEDIKYCIYSTISERAGRWFISIPVKENMDIYDNDNTLVIGIDFGVKTTAVLSNGETFENPKYLYQAECKLKQLQRELARRKKGGKNRTKTKQKLAKAHAKVANCRKHFIHQISYYVTVGLKPSTIVIEDLNVKGMLSNGHLSKAISDVGFHELRRQIEYKAERYNIEVIVADRWYASSKTCSECGWHNKDLKLSNRTFICNDCGIIIDRDFNAAKNLAAYGEGGNTAGLPRELMPVGVTVN